MYPYGRRIRKGIVERMKIKRGTAARAPGWLLSNSFSRRQNIPRAVADDKSVSRTMDRYHISYHLDSNKPEGKKDVRKQKEDG